jgi:hypothetical protein
VGCGKLKPFFWRDPFLPFYYYTNVSVLISIGGHLLQKVKNLRSVLNGGEKILRGKKNQPLSRFTIPVIIAFAGDLTVS